MQPRRAWTASVVSGALVTLAAACGTSSAPRAVPPPSASPATSTTTVPVVVNPIRPTGNASIDAALTQVARFVERERGHPFRTPVDVELADDATFRARVLEGFDVSRNALEREGRLLKALQVIPSSVDYATVSRKLVAEDVIGFYDPQKKSLLVRSATPDAWGRVILAHELTHALDDQWFGLYRPLVERDDEQSFGFAALVEGSAERVREAYLDQMSRSEKAEYRREQQAAAGEIDLSGIPPAVLDLTNETYTLGSVLVEHLIDQGGVARLDAAFRDPPRTSEQVMHPEKYDAHEPAIAIDVPATPAPPIDSGHFGEAFLRVLLATKLTPAQARRAAEGWGGDRYAMWSQDHTSCVRDDLAADTPTDFAELEAAFRSWASSHQHATVGTPSPQRLEVTACG